MQHEFPLQNVIPNTSPRIIAEIISIGDEISTGSILDTNAQFLSQSLSEIGVRVLYHSTIGDDMNAMLAAFTIAFQRADVIVTTGGLGSTQDDLTRQVMAKVIGAELEYDQSSYDHIVSLFQRRGRSMPDSNKIQAYFPSGSHIIYNPNGTAPGFFIETSRERILTSTTPLSGEFIALFFPGVPAEMKEMWRGADGRAAIERFSTKINGSQRRFYQNKNIHSFGLGESLVEEKLPNLIARDHYPTVGITAKDSIITLRIFAEGASENECNQQIEDTSKIIYNGIGEFVFGEDIDTFPAVISRSLRAQCRKVGIFEWGTQGALIKKLDPDILAFGRVFGKSEQHKYEELFGLSEKYPINNRQYPQTRDTFGCSYYTIQEEISDALHKIGAIESGTQQVDYYLAIGPFPSINGDDTDDSPNADVVFVDLRDPQKIIMRHESFIYGGQPAIIDSLFCNRALDMLRKYQ